MLLLAGLPLIVVILTWSYLLLATLAFGLLHPVHSRTIKISLSGFRLIEIYSSGKAAKAEKIERPCSAFSVLILLLLLTLRSTTSFGHKSCDLTPACANA